MRIRGAAEEDLGQSEPSTVASVDFCIPRDPRSAGLVRDGVGAFARDRGLCEEDVTALVTALGEALANAIEHSQCDAPIEIRCELLGEQILATVRDGGIGFGGRRPCAGELELPATDAERGRGLPIMRRLTDTFAIHSLPGGGTAVVLGRTLRYSVPGDPAA